MKPHRHEIKSKLKTQVVRDKTKEVSKKEQEELIVQMMQEAEELGLYGLINEEELEVRDRERNNFIKAQRDYNG